MADTAKMAPRPPRTEPAIIPPLLMMLFVCGVAVVVAEFVGTAATSDEKKADLVEEDFEDSLLVDVLDALLLDGDIEELAEELIEGTIEDIVEELSERLIEVEDGATEVGIVVLVDTGDDEDPARFWGTADSDGNDVKMTCSCVFGSIPTNVVATDVPSLDSPQP
jgi:hypothetical protein